MLKGQRPKLAEIVSRTFLAVALTLSIVNLRAQEVRKLISNPAPIYPEMARNYHITGVVKVRVLISPDGHIKSAEFLGGHPLLVDAVKETLKNWKYAHPAANQRPSWSSTSIHKPVGHAESPPEVRSCLLLDTLSVSI
jgi:TonB family protein